MPNPLLSLGYRLSLVLFPLFCGCQTPAVAPLKPSAAQLIEGKWTGTWNCETTGHSGKLHCQLIHVQDNHYRAKYSGTYMTLLPFWYSVDMVINCSSQACHIQAEADLGWLGGRTLCLRWHD